MESVKHLLARTDRWYLIATADDSAIDHEIAHGLFYTNDSYRACVCHLLSKLDLSKVFSRLKEMGYDGSVFLDETNAFLGTSTEAELDLFLRMDAKRQKLEDTVSALRYVYEYTSGRKLAAWK